MQVLNIVIRIPTNEILVAVPLSPLYALHYLMSLLRGPLVLTTLEGLQIGVLITKSKGFLITLDQYLSTMKSGQEKIFYVIVNKEQLEKSPFVEMLTKKNVEVILFTSDIDHRMMHHHLVEYKGKKFHDLSKDGFKFGKKNLEKSFKELARWWRLLLKDENVDVKINHLLVDTPCVVVNSNYGLSPFLERVSKSRALSEVNEKPYMRGKRVLEINPQHPIIRKLCGQVAKEPKDERVRRIARAMYGIALRESGLELTQWEVSTFDPYGFIEGEEESEETKVGKIGQRVWAIVENVFPLPWKDSNSDIPF
ncbi:hypothetical protein T459_13413 [Capsicum annuum]|uniref:Endoplasmin homolog n=1 Tax=Capsicum annuum TaxID=4072 RepID=A0A2G2ZSK9_CAPAN|nr:hypothetical protein T459_13413 [Capsicum annuum]